MTFLCPHAPRGADEAVRLSAGLDPRRPPVSACAPALDLGDCARG